MEFVELIVINIVTSTVFVGGLLWFLKYYLGKRIDNLFTQKEKLLEARIRIAEKYEEKKLEDMASALARIQQTVYHCRLYLRDVIKSGQHESLVYLGDKWERLTEQLVMYQLQLSEDLFEAVHKYKGLVHTMLLTLQASTDGEGRVDEEARKTVEEHFGELETLYHGILDRLRAIMAEMPHLGK